MRAAGLQTTRGIPGLWDCSLVHASVGINNILSNTSEVPNVIPTATYLTHQVNTGLLLLGLAHPSLSAAPRISSSKRIPMA